MTSSTTIAPGKASLAVAPAMRMALPGCGGARTCELAGSERDLDLSREQARAGERIDPDRGSGEPRVTEGRVGHRGHGGAGSTPELPREAAPMDALRMASGTLGSGEGDDREEAQADDELEPLRQQRLQHLHVVLGTMIEFIEQEPGPRGLPQVPHGPMAGAASIPRTIWSRANIT